MDDFARFDSVIKTTASQRQYKQSVLYTHSNDSEQYSENIVATILTTMASFVSSVAVTSMKTLCVSNVILLCSELMIGGIDRTRSSES